jgi:streptogramin lyase
MMIRTRLLAPILLLSILFSPCIARAQTPASPALTGRVSSQEEGPMEGVLVSAKRAGSTIRITVVTDQQGRYSFPRNKLEPGRYSLSIRAVGYEMDPATAQVTSQKPLTEDLQLRKTKDLATQLTNAEWLLSMPPDERKEAGTTPGLSSGGAGGSVLLGCTTCHTVQRIVSSRHDATEFTHVMQRMAGYYPGATPLLPQRIPAIDRHPGDPERFRKPAEYLSTVNLSKVSKWEYPLKTLPRPKGRSTRVIITEYDLPRKVSQPHDVIIDSDGMAWYMDFGQQFLGKLNPKNGQVTEYPVPLVKPEEPRGGLEVEADRDGNIWFGMQFQAGIAKFDRKTEKFQVFSLPKEFNTDTSQVSMVVPTYSHLDGKVWMKDAGSTSNIKRVDIASGKFDAVDPFPDDSHERGQRQHAAYGISADTQNNCYFMDLRNEFIGKVDAKTLKVKLYRTPTPNSGPRRGHADSEDRLWFGEYRSNKVAMFDPRTEEFREWAIPTPYTNPYDAVVDKNGEVWSGGMSSDRIIRINSKTGQIAEYLLPEETNVRRVFVDNSTTPVTFWVGNDQHASVIKLETLD